ncbi:tetratricopeptide repeat protein [Pseudoalteromonas sp. SSDWG2]|uniref:tetratricopeptide repeat protein n=1 Tax=Pseudoalteromonas sp. SSDWG2 TaxID=3139391 RepID=UPI003BAC9578
MPAKLLYILLFLSALCLNNAAYADERQQRITELERQLSTAPLTDKGVILTELVEAYRDNDPPKSLEYADQALIVFAQSPDPKRHATVLNNMIWTLVSMGQYERAQQLTNQSKQIATELADARGIYVATTMQGIIYWRTADYPSALKQFEIAKDIATKQDDTRGIANTTNYIAIIYQTMGQPKKALENFQRALELQTQMDEPKSIAVSLNNIANMHGTSGNYSLALDYQLKSLKIREELNDIPGLAQILGNIGLTYFYLEDYDLALSYLQRSLGYYQSLKDTLGTSETLTSLGATHQRKGQFEAALHQYDEALEIAEQLQDQGLMARIHIDIASTFIELGDAAKAKEHAQPALQHIAELQIVPLQANALLVNAKVAKLENDYERAIHLTNRSVEVATDTDDKRLRRDAYEFLYILFKDRGDLASALTYLEKFKQLNDEMFNSESDQRMAFLLSHFEAEKREQQIKLLQADKNLKQKEIEQQRYNRNTVIASLCALFAFILLFLKRMHQNKINRSLNENIKSQRELIQAIAHEFRAPLARVQLAFDMLEANLANESGNTLAIKINDGLSELEQLIKEALDFIQLENNGDIITYSDVKLGNMLSTLLESHVDLYPDIDFDLNEKGQQPCVVEADATALNRAVSNIVRNGARFAKQQVCVTLNNQPSFYEIIVEDDGPGIPLDQRQRVQEPFVRLDLSRCRDSGGVGLGLALAKKIIQAHQGTLSIETSALGGAKIILHCPKARTKTH